MIHTTELSRLLQDLPNRDMIVTLKLLHCTKESYDRGQTAEKDRFEASAELVPSVTHPAQLSGRWR